eukprot:TRINITY_DN10726_c0_g1_i1.p1 TRINITY_DN10726_c0_g1~~TRINITY_DN10726_c0_g1_i1.p1  ORF type:complete len:404 (-),score=91.11 TRINITY_DN10726_c0_g1_i1:2-1213(-)
MARGGSKKSGRCASFVKNHLGPFILRFILFVAFLASVFSFSIWFSAKYTQGLTSWADVQFNWTYTPKQSNFSVMNPEFQNYTILLDGHSHTESLSPEQSVLWHIANGYNAAIITNHNTIAKGYQAQQIARQKYPNQIKVLVGQEYSSCRIHMGLIFPPNVNVTAPIPSSAWPTDEEIKEVINMTHSFGGLCSVNHIPWSAHALHEQWTIQQLFDWGVDFVEIVNGGTFDYQSYNFALQNGMGVITGTDMHTPGAVYGWTTLLSNFTEEAIFEALVAKQTSIIYSAIPSPHSASPNYKSGNLFLDPIYRITNFLKSYYVYHSGQWSFNGSFCSPNSLTIQYKQMWVMVGYLLGGYALFEILSQTFYHCVKTRKCCKSCRKSESEGYAELEERYPLRESKDPMHF